MEAATQTKIDVPRSGEYVFITPRGGGLPFFVLDPTSEGGKPEHLIRGTLVDERGRTLSASWQCQRKDVLKCHRAIQHPTGVLVPV